MSVSPAPWEQGTLPRGPGDQGDPLAGVTWQCFCESPPRRGLHPRCPWLVPGCPRPAGAGDLYLCAPRAPPASCTTVILVPELIPKGMKPLSVQQWRPLPSPPSRSSPSKWRPLSQAHLMTWGPRDEPALRHPARSFPCPDTAWQGAWAAPEVPFPHVKPIFLILHPPWGWRGLCTPKLRHRYLDNGASGVSGFPPDTAHVH